MSMALYTSAVPLLTKPNLFETMADALASLPEYLADSFGDIAAACERVPPAPNIRAVVVDVTSWAERNGEPEYVAKLWLQRLANVHVRVTIHNGEMQLCGYRPILRIEHVTPRDANQHLVVAVSVPTFGELADEAGDAHA